MMIRESLTSCVVLFQSEFLSLYDLVTWCTILYELKSRMLLKSVIKHRNNMLNVDILFDAASILLSEHRWFFCCLIEASSKHSTEVTSMFLNYTNWIQFLILVNTDSYSSMYTAILTESCATWWSKVMSQREVAELNRRCKSELL